MWDTLLLTVLHDVALNQATPQVVWRRARPNSVELAAHSAQRSLDHLLRSGPPGKVTPTTNGLL